MLGEPMKKYNTNDPEAVEIRKKIETLISVNDGIEIYDVISIEEVRKFEAEHDLKLPEDYVWFITNVGNGGTWYDGSYPFYPLKQTYFSAEGLPGYKRGINQYAIDILSKGCSYSIGLILKGEHFGEVSNDGDGLAYYHPLPFHGFKEFYLKWLEEAVLGYDVLGFEKRPYGTIEEHLKQYKHNPEHNLLWAVFSKINPKCASKQFVLDVYNVFVSEAKNENKIMLAKILLKIGYEDAFSVFNAIFIPENYEEIVWLLRRYVYFRNWIAEEGITEDAPRYYPMLIQIMRYYETAKERDQTDFGYCFNMTVMNPQFKADDILGILTSDEEGIVKYLAVSVYKKNILEHVRMYIDEAKIKYQKMEEKKMN